MQRCSAPRLASPPESAHDGGGDPALLDAIESEALLLNINAALRVYSRHHLFGWTQGLLQNLVRHELLVCALYSTEPISLRVESVAGPAVDPAHISDMIHQDTLVLPHVIKAWEENQFRPVNMELQAAGTLGAGALGRELHKMGAERVVAHGTYDAFGKPASFFMFACAAGAFGPKQAFVVELIVPFLHQAWLRTQIDQSRSAAGASPRGVRLLTAREQEILKWVRIGKSNIEIGVILGLSPLTVKNHVQKILRKLDVQNRTQAVGKALALRILSL